jgi:hypothetical protein
MIKRNSKQSPRTIRPLTERELATAAGGLYTGQNDGSLLGIYYNNMGGGLLGVKSLTTGIGGLIG